MDGRFQMGMRPRRPSLKRDRETEGASPSEWGCQTSRERERGKHASGHGVVLRCHFPSALAQSVRLAGPQVSRADTYLFDCRGCAALFGVEINEVDVYGYIKSQSYVLSCDALSQTYG